MKPARFEYHDPKSVEEALRILDSHQSDCKILAGGQSLMPLLNMRLARPKTIVDINRIEGLDYIRAENNSLTIGANARQRALQRDGIVAERVPVLRAAAAYIAHPQIRSRGTICGSLAHADPAAELPALALALDAGLVAIGPKGKRTIPAESFFMSYFTTALEPNELLVEARFPVPPKDMAWSVLEVSRRHGDFALVGIVAGLALDHRSRSINGARLVCFGVGPTPGRLKEVEQALIGQTAADGTFRNAGEMASQSVDPDNDVHASAEYRRSVAGVLVRRGLSAALGKLKDPDASTGSA